MTELASPAQLRSAFARWALFLVPGILLLGMLSFFLGSGGAGNAWFHALTKPDYCPSSVTFVVMWSFLYILLGVAVSIIAAARGASGRQIAIAVFGFQLVLALAWAPTMFATQQLAAAFGLVVLMVLLTCAMIYLFWRIRPIAAVLLLPYLAWLLFTAVLTYDLMVANPHADGRQMPGAVTRIQL